jgi:hypothetical protein
MSVMERGIFHIVRVAEQETFPFSIICKAAVGVCYVYGAYLDVSYNSRRPSDRRFNKKKSCACQHYRAPPACVYFNQRRRICHQISTFPLYEYRLARNNKSSSRRFCSSSFSKNRASGWLGGREIVVNPLHQNRERVITDGGLTLGASLRLIMLAVN